MSDMFENDAEVVSQVEAVEKLDMAQLRKAAKALGITAQRDWSKDDFILAIQAKQSNSAAVQVVFDPTLGPKPGYARVLIHRDPSPNHKNSPVHVGLNGQIYQIPRNFEVDIPIPFVEVLKNARSVQTKQAGDASRENPGGIYKDEEQTSYPFQVISMTPGRWVNPHDNRAHKFKLKKEFHTRYGSWPTDGELKEFQKNKMRKD